MSAVPTIAGKLRVDIKPIALSASILVTSLYSNSSFIYLRLALGILGLLQYNQLAEFAQRWDVDEG